MEILMSGEIYLKRGPRIIPSKDVSNRNDERLDMIEEHLKTDPKASPEELEKFRYFRDLVRDSVTVERKDYSGCDSFWISIVEDDCIRMVEMERPYATEKVFETKEDLNKEFIRLRVFLEQAEYIGRYFKRTKPCAEGPLADRSYTHDSNSLALYATDSILLIQSETPYFKDKKFEIISSKYLEDSNYEFIGKVNNEFRDKPELYQAILRQLTDKPRKTL